MKRALSIAITIIFLLLPGVSRAQACNTVDIDSDIMSKSAMITAIEDALSDYQQGGVYGICFDMHDEALLLGALGSQGRIIQLDDAAQHRLDVTGVDLLHAFLGNTERFQIVTAIVSHEPAGNTAQSRNTGRQVGEEKGHLTGIGDGAVRRVEVDSTGIRGHSEKPPFCWWSTAP